MQRYFEVLVSLFIFAAENFEGMENWLERTELLLGENRLKVLQKKNVLVVGLGGVGAYAAEMIVRAGIGKMTIVDGDSVNASNINRQLPALQSNVGKAKAQIMAARLQDINPELILDVIEKFIPEEEMDQLVNESFDYVVDAIDTLTPKIHLIKTCVDQNVKLISSMGAGGKTDPSQVKIADLSESYNCKLARMLRKRLSRLHIKTGFQIVFSHEQINMAAVVETQGELNKRSTVGTISYMPALFGIYCASQVIRDLQE